MTERMSTAEFLALQQKPKRNKYRNKKVTIDGMLFDSMAEGDYYNYLKLLRQAGEVTHFLRQVPFDLPGKTKYRLDFLVFYASRAVEYVDVKGSVTAEFKLKKRQVEDLYPVKIRCVWKTGRGFEEKQI